MESNKQGGVTQYQKFALETVHRSQIKNAEYNPRHITDEARIRLRDTIQRVGLVQPIVWNKRTGNVVGGHQRLRQIDALEGRADYSMDVAVVDVDDARERELNVLLNNPEVCGEWDLEKLQELLDFDGLDTVNTGFDEAELLRMFGEAPKQTGESGETVLQDLKKVKDAYERLAESTRSKDDRDFYSVIVFASYDDRKAFTDSIGLQDNRYIDARVLLALLREKVGAVKEPELAVPLPEPCLPDV